MPTSSRESEIQLVLRLNQRSIGVVFRPCNGRESVWVPWWQSWGVAVGWRSWGEVGNGAVVCLLIATAPVLRVARSSRGSSISAFRGKRGEVQKEKLSSFVTMSCSHY